MQEELAQFDRRRRRWVKSLERYAAYLRGTSGTDAEMLKVRTLISRLQRETLRVAVVGECGRARSALINALFFHECPGGFLPVEAGRASLCPIEIYRAPEDAPALLLLPIETRGRGESIEDFKRLPVEWSTIALDSCSPQALAAALDQTHQSLALPQTQAQAIGLGDGGGAQPTDGEPAVSVPAWRYARLNYPHPLLEAGLVVIDTPGLDALRAEPELILGTLTEADVVLFVAGASGTVTDTELDAWNRHIRPHVRNRLAVLHPTGDAQPEPRQLEENAARLGLPFAQVFPVSAAGGIERLQTYLGSHVLPAKRDFLEKTLRTRAVPLVSAALRLEADALRQAAKEERELRALSGQNREVMRGLHERITADRQSLAATVQDFNQTRNALARAGRTLLGNLGPEAFEPIAADSREALAGSWTTAALVRGMRTLTEELSRQFDKTLVLSHQIRRLVDNAYANFSSRHGFAPPPAPSLDLAPHRDRLRGLAARTRAFGRDPINVMTEKRFLIRKFYSTLVARAEDSYRLAYAEADGWLAHALEPLLRAVKEYKGHLERRADNLRRIQDNLGTLKQTQAAVAERIQGLRQTGLELQDIRAALSEAPARGAPHAG